jgi:WD repeat-containing protein 21A
MTLDPFADFLLAAGQDCRIRGWSTRTGRHILVPQTEVDNPSQDLWTTVFNKPILGMDVSEERGRTFVWVANETKVDKFELGKMV